jgi:PhnB protein
MRAKTTPEGYHTLNPFLRVADAAAALHFYQTAFGAKEDFRREMHGRLLIAVIMIGDSRVMISDHSNEPEKVAGGDPRGNGLGLKIYVDNVDDVFRRAIGAGATELEPLQDHFSASEAAKSPTRSASPGGWRNLSRTCRTPRSSAECDGKPASRSG